MDLSRKKGLLGRFLTLKAERSFLIRVSEPFKILDSVNELTSIIVDHYQEKKFPIDEINSHIFSIFDDQTKDKLKSSIKRFESNLLRRPRAGLLNIGIIDFDFILKTPNEYQRLLKTLEEPPRNSQIYILATNHSAVPSTILSRLVVINDFYDARKLEANNSILSFEDSLLDITKKINTLSPNDLKNFLMEVLSLNKLKALNYNQLKYIQNLILSATQYKELNLRPLDSEISLIKRLHKENL